MLDEIVGEREVRKGRVVRGHLCTLKSGEVVYLARRKHGQIFRSGRSSISGAMSDGEASWAIDEELLYSLRARGVRRVGVRVTDTGDLYLAELKNFFDLTKAGVRDYTGVGRGGSRQRYLRLQHFSVTRGRVVLDA